jgi:hypothetical protein
MGKKKVGQHKPSSRESHVRRVARASKRLEMKINRWKRYQQEITSGKRKGNPSRWNTEGLQKHLEFLGGLSCVGPKQK